MNHQRSMPLLPQLRLASPCTMRWEDMEGDERTRYCGSCRLHVHNLSAMSSAQAEALVERTLGQGERLCGFFYQRADGTVMTQDCPVGLVVVRARVRRRLARIAAALGMVATGGAMAAGGARDSAPRLRALRPFSIIAEWLAPTPPPPPAPVAPPLPGGLALGKMACPAPPPNVVPPGASLNH